jgi:hypothetical protein
MYSKRLLLIKKAGNETLKQAKTGQLYKRKGVFTYTKKTQILCHTTKTQRLLFHKLCVGRHKNLCRTAQNLCFV